MSLLPGVSATAPAARDDDTAIWAQLMADLGAAGSYADRTPNPNPNNLVQTSQVRQELVNFINYERNKATRLNMPSAPFIIRSNTSYNNLNPPDPNPGPGYNKLPYAPYEQFRSEIARLKNKTFAKDAAAIEESMMKLQKIFSLRKVTIHGKDLQLKDFPDDANHGLPGHDRLDVPTIIKIKYELGQKYLDIRWDALEGKSFFVRVERADNNNEISRIETQNHMQKVPLDAAVNEVRVKVMVKKTPTAVPNFGDVEGTVVHIPDQDVTIQKYRMNPSNSLFPIDKFRLEICDKYKTLYDLFQLVPTVTDDLPFDQAHDELRNAYNGIDFTNVEQWEYLRIPNTWKNLSYWEKVLVIVFKGKPMEVSINAIQSRIATLYDADIINKPYATHPAKGGLQRMTGAKRPYYALTTIPTQLDSAFVNRGNQYKAVQIKNIIENSTWKQSKKYFKKNSVVYGRGYHDFIYLDTRLEREACDTLRRIDRLLRLSHERGYPVLNKSVAAPYNYANNTSFARDTMFGVNNYDRTQSYPPLQAAPLIMARSNVGDNAKARIEDPQKTFDRRGMTKAAKMIDVVKVDTGDPNNRDIYYNHPMYPSKQKKDAWGRL
jgi:hypothetical protein